MPFPFLKSKGPTEVNAPTPAGIADFIAPSAVEVGSNFLTIGERLCRTIFVFAYPRYLGTNWFSPVINLARIFDASVAIVPVDTGLILRRLRKKVAEVESTISMRQEKGLVRDPLLETAYQDLEDLRDKLQQARERLFSAGLYLTIYGPDEKTLDDAEAQIRGLLEARLVYARPATFQHELGFSSTLPLANDKLHVTTNLTSSPLSTIFPFVSSELTSDRGILYGINRHNNSLILFDRFSLENANSVIFAKSGGGKSYLAKLEILRSMMLGADVIVIDPENEYRYLAEAVGGSFIKISLASKHHLNPFDLPRLAEGESPEDVFRAHLVELVGLLRIMLGGITPEEDAILDRALGQTYASRDIVPTADFANATPPTLSDLQTILENTAGAQELATRLSKYTTGSYAGFLNQQTNVTLENQFVVFNIRDMEEELRPIAMYLVLHYIWNAVRRELKKRILFVDEAWVLMKADDGAAFMYSIAKRARKYYLGLTTITQDVADFIKSKYGEPIVTNSSLQILLKQSPATIEAVARTFNLTDEEKFLLLEANVGEGIFFAGLKRAAIKVVASYSEDQIITTDPEQLIAIERAKKELAATQI
ncbi:ATP-binding protein [Candidatus Parcubacteria bacterium]|nr:ATP-binding protein [Candidatus Parcubacteria bacterium]